jgi:hypothetical protein
MLPQPAHNTSSWDPTTLGIAALTLMLLRNVTSVVYRGASQRQGGKSATVTALVQLHNPTFRPESVEQSPVT